MILAHWILFVGAMMPYGIVAIAKWSRDYDNSDPRNPANFAEPVRQRAYAAHNNAFEAFPFFAAGVLLATIRGADSGTVNAAACVWLAARLIYFGSYLTERPALRSAAWFVASFATITIYLTALLH
jgi:uncharacterized MAPEG superfamily protein